MEKANNQVIMMVNEDQLQEIVVSAVRLAMDGGISNPSAKVYQLGEYIPQSEAMRMLNRKTTWFHLKRRSGELVAKKSANQWWYKRSDLENYVENGFESNEKYEL